MLAGCTTPAQRFDDRAGSLGFAPIVLQGTNFAHRSYTSDLDGRSGALHVYIEHDGTPWIDHRFVADDPTPRTPFALELMGRDSGPRLLLGRPCYFEPEAACEPLLWTHRRYAPEVIASMVAALRSFLARHPFREVLLIGYSGGGTVAWLMAARLPDTVGVVTIAANLDIDEWTRVHGYSTMAGSLNPASLPPLPRATTQVNYFGGRDLNVPPLVARSFARNHSEATMIEIPEFDHLCCWIERWPELLRETAGYTSPGRAAPRP